MLRAMADRYDIKTHLNIANTANIALFNMQPRKLEST